MTKTTVGSLLAVLLLASAARAVTEPLQHGSGAAGVFETLSTGVKGTAMVPFKQLSEEDRWAVAYYVMSLREGQKK